MKGLTLFYAVPLRHLLPVPDPLHILLQLSAWDHNLMSASDAFQPEIRSGPQHLPLIAATGMRFL